MSQRMTKPTNWHVRPAKTQISLGIRPFWSESLLCAKWVAKDPSFLHADSEDTDQTGRMPRLILVFAGRTCYFVGFVVRWLICGQRMPRSSRHSLSTVRLTINLRIYRRTDVCRLIWAFVTCRWHNHPFIFRSSWNARKARSPWRSWGSRRQGIQRVIR